MTSKVDPRSETSNHSSACIMFQHYTMNDEDGKEDLYRNGKDMTDIYIKKNKEGAIVLISDIDYKTVSVCSYYVI